MIAKEIAMPRRGGSFRGLVTYLTSTRGKAERVGRIELTNCVSADVGGAVLEVEAMQGRNQRARHRTYHLLLSFREDLAPGVLAEIEHRACAALGFETHQRVSVVHHDTDHMHVHIAINRVNPQTHRVHWPSYSKLALDQLCVELERKYGLVADRHRTREREPLLAAAEKLRAAVKRDCAAQLLRAQSWPELHEVAAAQNLRLELRGNGLALVAPDGLGIRASTVDRALSKASLERRLGRFAREPHSDAAEVNQSDPGVRRAPDIERYAGVERLIGWVQRNCAAELERSGSWAELHAAAHGYGLRVQPRGNGLVFVDAGGVAIKGSSVSRELSKAALERRLGAFQVSTGVEGERRTTYAAEPFTVPAGRGLYARYCEEREETLQRRARVVTQLRHQRERDAERLRAVSRRRWAAIRLVAKGPVAWKLWRAYARQADRRDRERARERYRAALRTVAAAHRRVVWVDWLRAKAADGDAEALALLRARRSGAQPARGAIGSDAPPREVPAVAIDGVTGAGTVIYRVGHTTIRDDGKRLHLAGAQTSESAAEALLRFGHQRYGTVLGVDGDDGFRERIVRAAAKADVPITFADKRLEQRRIDLEQLQRKERGDGERRTSERSRQRPERARAIARAPGAGVVARLGPPEPHAGDDRREAPASSLAGLRRVSSIPVVRFGRTPAVLLPADARRHVDERRTQADSAVRRADHQRPVGDGGGRGRKR